MSGCRLFLHFYISTFYIKRFSIRLFIPPQPPDSGGFYRLMPWICFTSLITKVLSMELRLSISPSLLSTNS